MSGFTIYRTNRLPQLGVTYIAVTSGRERPDTYYGEYFILTPSHAPALQYGHVSFTQIQLDTYRNYEETPPLDLEAEALEEALDTVWAALESLPVDQRPRQLGESSVDAVELFRLVLRNKCDKSVFSKMAEVTRNAGLGTFLRGVAHSGMSLRIAPARGLEF